MMWIADHVSLKDTSRPGIEMSRFKSAIPLRSPPILPTYTASGLSLDRVAVLLILCETHPL